MAAEKVIIPLGPTKMAVLSIQEFDKEIEVEELIQIDYSNLLGEIITFPVVFNRIANLRAEANNLLGRATFDMKVIESQLYEEYRNKEVDGKKISQKDAELAVPRDPRMKKKMESLFQMQRYYDYCDALYWSAQSKDTKLNKLMERVTPKEFENELLEGTINSIAIKIKRKSIIG